jgi:hypothetical protein
LSWPTRVKRHRPEDTSHTLIDLSREPEAKNGPEMKIKVMIDGFLPGKNIEYIFRLLAAMSSLINS